MVMALEWLEVLVIFIGEAVTRQNSHMWILTKSEKGASVLVQTYSAFVCVLFIALVARQEFDTLISSLCHDVHYTLHVINYV
jgi:hypothetical protein